MSQHLHIVCFDVPYPPDYGGVVDLFFKIKYLHDAGVKIHLHCFEYGRGRQEVLKQYCEEVYYYPRKKVVLPLLPFIVASRKNQMLKNRLLADSYPVLLEGVHCSYHLFKGDLPAGRCWVRLHNVEWKYYANLAKSSGAFLKSLYFLWESWMLKRYEKKLAVKGRFLCLNREDVKVYQSMGAKRVEYLPVFVEDGGRVFSKEGKGDYCLYHGNLSVSENEKVVTFLIQEVCTHLPVKFVVAGKNPSVRLMTLCRNHHVECIVNPSETELHNLIREAQLNVLPSANNTGIKVKIINALSKGRFVMTNKEGVDKATSWKDLCIVANDAAEWRESISSAMEKRFTLEDIARRQEVLSREFSVVENTQRLLSFIL
ncbi:MAG: glycosyltransferase [Chitinophagaceae bacterium]|nr:glycosyltransferase [Chitinophagaceae bacterium]MCW5914043.1 glycosyltransferase [Chitinophagaceae bacterium]MCZ2396024.1 glycosyltransferase family 4 protein [Chitinophagales bacterium]